MSQTGNALVNLHLFFIENTKRELKPKLYKLQRVFYFVVGTNLWQQRIQTRIPSNESLPPLNPQQYSWKSDCQPIIASFRAWKTNLCRLLNLNYVITELQTSFFIPFRCCRAQWGAVQSTHLCRILKRDELFTEQTRGVSRSFFINLFTFCWSLKLFFLPHGLSRWGDRVFQQVVFFFGTRFFLECMVWNRYCIWGIGYKYSSLKLEI